MNQSISVGQTAPAFHVKDSKGNPISSKLLLGRPYVIYFYPKDDTPGCTTEACDLRDIKDQLNELNVSVIGISPDSDVSHNAFIEKHHLNFPLISDPQHELCSLFGVWEEKTVFGKKGFGVVRSTFIIDAKGMVAWIEKPVQVKGHADRILQALQEMTES